MPGGRPPKPAAVHKMNGNPSRLSRSSLELSMPGSEVGVGAPPRGMSADEKREWKLLVLGGPWLNATNRGAVELAVSCAVRWRSLERYFRLRCAAARRAGRPEAEGWLGDEGRRHPLVLEYRDARDAYRGVLADLGFTPRAQSQLLRHIDSVMTAQRKEAKAAAKADDFLT